MKSPAQYRPAVAVLVGGGLAATLDILYAFYRNGISTANPLRVLQSVASGWLGKDAFTNGVAAAMLGLASHYVILLIAAGIYMITTHRLVPMQKEPLLCGGFFGALVYLFMNFVVVPFSAVPFHLNYTTIRIIEGFVSHALLVGLPIAWAVKRWALVRPISV